ncbi:MAG: undecaprenyl-diphosphate phosphatase, partial [Desulfofustis sp.]|nr:undecaprenyl-diphosphate phosphatase [Desulfofustis sp.]
MELIKALLLGFIQGATEFLPVSSSGHLVLGSHLLGFTEQSIAFDVMLHIGTLVSVLLVFRRDIASMLVAPWHWLRGNRSDATLHFLRWDAAIIVATIPAVIVGLTMKDLVEALFTSLLVVYLMLAVTGVLMILSSRLVDRGSRITWWRALLIGVGQACAIVPGLSRSGTTIFTAMLLGVNRETAARFSFLMSLPAILGAAVLHLGDVVRHPPEVQSLVY